MNITVIKATDKRTNTVVFAEGIEDSSCNVQIIVPRNLFTPEEVVSFKADELLFSAERWGDVHSENVNLGCSDAHCFTCELTNLKIEIVNVDIKDISFLSTVNYNDNNLVAVLTVTKKSDNEIIFAEGTDPDGYGYHQVSFDKTLVDATDSPDDEFLLSYLLGKEIEAKDIAGDYKNVKIQTQYFLID